MPDAVPPEVQSLIHGPVASMEHVELLLALRAVEPEPRTVEALARDAQVGGPAIAQRQLDALAAGALVQRLEDGRYRYAPRGRAQRDAVDALATVYQERPLTLVRAIHRRPSSPLRSFADAFRLRDPNR